MQTSIKVGEVIWDDGAVVVQLLEILDTHIVVDVSPQRQIIPTIDVEYIESD